MPSKKKKKKKDKNRDIDIIQKVQDSVQAELERLKNSTLALGQNPGDAQPVVRDRDSVKKKKKMKRDKSEKKLKTEVSETVSETTEDGSGRKSEEFKPYDYSNAAQKLSEGGFEVIHVFIFLSGSTLDHFSELRCLMVATNFKHQKLYKDIC